MATAYLPPDTLDDLRAVFHSCLMRGERLMEIACDNCTSNSLAIFEPVEIAFGLGKGPPVHLAKNSSVRACLGCGMCEFVVRERDLAKIRAVTGADLRPRLPSIGRAARRTA